MPVTYSEHIPEQDKLLSLYQNAGWSAYTKDPEKLIAACKSSLNVIVAMDEDKLIGLIRTIGDGHTILYIQDILVHTSYKRKGIGKKLLMLILDKYPTVRQTVLLTDDSEETRGFYEAVGFQSCDKGSLVSFALFR